MWKSEFDFDGSYLYDSATENTEMNAETIMKEIQSLYRKKRVGLKDTAKSIPSRSIQATMPRNKVTVLIVGSHSAAKQKFLDLYFSDSRQVAATDGFVSRVNYDKLDKIYITHGNRRKLLVGETVLDYCPHLSYLRNIPGVKDYLTTEIATRNTKSLVSFILAPEPIPAASNSIMTMTIRDSSELDDNNNSITSVPKKRSLDMRQAIGKLTETADLIFIFFDPTGTVHPRETLQPFEHIWEAHHEKILFLLARAEVDETSDETREDVLTQIVREIWRNPTVRRVGYLPEIYCPDVSSGIRDDQRLWNIIQNSADQSIDKALMQLEQDATAIKNKLETIRNENSKAKQDDGGLVSAFTIALVVVGVCCSYLYEVMDKRKGRNTFEVCTEILRDRTVLTTGIFLLFVYLVYIICSNTRRAVLSDAEELLLERRIAFTNHALNRKKTMEKIFR